MCQPRVAAALACYLNEFDDIKNHYKWLPVTDHPMAIKRKLPPNLREE